MSKFILISWCLASTLGLSTILPAQEDNTQWLSWRGPYQTGVSAEKYETWDFEGEKSIKWTLDVMGRGAPVVADGRAYSFGYAGEGPDLQVVLACIDVETGKIIWEDRVSDFISDTIYNRYGIGSPAIDPETRNIYLMTGFGLFSCYDKDGKLLWRHSMMEQFGRLTFPNGRTGAPMIEGNLVIVRGITSFWGSQGPARDRFYAFDKKTGEPVWASTPGTAPQDSSYSTPYFETRYGMRVFYSGTGCGNMVAVNALNGKPLWRFRMSKGGVNSAPVIYKDTLISPHGKENLDTSEMGRMVQIKLPTSIDPTAEQIVIEGKEEIWRNPISAFSSSPVLHGNRVYQLNATGNLCCVDADTGKILWQEKLAADNIHSSPLLADGIIYAPLHSGEFFVVKPSDDGAEILHRMQLEGNCFGAPSLWRGHLFVHTTKKLYCFKLKTGKISYDTVPVPEPATKGDSIGLVAVPNELLLQSGDEVSFKMNQVDAYGNVGESVSEAEWASWLPPTAK
ncbi:MAG: PQQ-binding-like beta-propeller repeat protein, partial [Verrucomicrobiota bacterium]